MSVLSVEEAADPQVESTLNEKGNTTYRRVFEVLTDNPYDGSLVAATATDPSTFVTIPVLFDPYVTDGEDEYDNNAWAMNIRSRRVDGNPYLWQVTVEYSNQWPNPLDKPLLKRWSTEKISDAIQEDLDGNKVTNSAGMPFDPAPETQRRVVVLTIRKNVADFDYTTYRNAIDCVNSDVFYGFAAETVLFDDFTAEEVNETYVNSDGDTTLTYWTVTGIFKIGLIITRDDMSLRYPWRLNLLDAGFCELDSDGNPTPIRDTATGAIVSHISLLDGAGAKLDDPSASDATFLEFRIRETAVFADLGLT